MTNKPKYFDANTTSSRFFSFNLDSNNIVWPQYQSYYCRAKKCCEFTFVVFWCCRMTILSSGDFKCSQKNTAAYTGCAIWTSRMPLYLDRIANNLPVEDKCCPTTSIYLTL